MRPSLSSAGCLEIAFSDLEYLGNCETFFNPNEMHTLFELYIGNLEWLIDGQPIIENLDPAQKEIHDVYRFALYCRCWLKYTSVYPLNHFGYSEIDPQDPLGVRFDFDEAYYFLEKKNEFWSFSSPLLENDFPNEVKIKPAVITDLALRHGLKVYVNKLDLALNQHRIKSPYTTEEYVESYKLYDYFKKHINW